MNWHEKIAQEMGIKHSDTVAVVRWGGLAKRATNRRLRRQGRTMTKKDEDREADRQRIEQEKQKDRERAERDRPKPKDER
jgi:hypothetical protein